MSIETVQSIVKKQMTRISFDVVNNEKIEVFEVQKRIVRGGIARQQRFNIFFVDGKMTKYEKDSEKFSF